MKAFPSGKKIPAANKESSSTLSSKPKVLSANLFPVVGIGASAGGLDAFKKLLKAIPEDSGMAYVLVQHLDPTHESMLPNLLQRVTKIPVLEIADDIKVEPNHIYVIPANKMMVATDGILVLTPRPAKSKTERNLPIDLFFTSLAEVHQAHAIGVVLSGTASDGTLGLKAIKDHGGITFAQDEESAAYEGMPHSAAQAGVVDFILPPDKIPQKLLEVVGIIKGNEGDATEMPLSDVDVFKQILSLLRIRKGIDFTYYKQPTIGRRILRRMALNKNEEPAAYLKYLRENKAEQDVLYQDMLIPVTSFFRDKKTFDNLCEVVFPHLLKTKTSTEPIRVWVAGCSTGEEAYSIAICLKEYLGEDHHNVQIFGTDLSEPAIAKARFGVYKTTELTAVSPQRLQEYFTKTNGSYQVNKNIRDICVFAHHNFLKDPPFGKMDFISCRNVLIYMEPYLQKKALTTFHYALNPKGFLVLGKSETSSGVPDLFVAASKTDKLFTRKDVPGRFMHVTSLRSEQNFGLADAIPNSETIRTDFEKTADDIMLRKYTPAGVVVNEAMDIVHFRGNTGNYLEQSPGKPSHNLLQMAKSGLAFELRNILHKAKKDKATVIKENIPMELNGGLHNISIEAIPLPNLIEPHYLILFHDNDSIGNKSRMAGAIGNKKTAPGNTRKNDQDLRIQQLEKELSQAREDMRSITEDQEAANEELQSANEELLSSSEELQSLNEELETGKEELQSTNEELTVVNEEMISLNEQLTVSRDYAEAIIINIHEPLLVLDKKLQIKTANDAFYKTFGVTELETEGSLIYNLGNGQWDIPELRTLLEKILPEKLKINDFKVAHHFSSIGNRVMLLNAREVINKNSLEKLILLSIEDITEREKAQDIIKKSGEYFRHLIKELPAAVYSCDAQGHITFYNDAALKIWGRKPEIGKDKWCGSDKMYKPDGTPMPLDQCPMAIAIKECRAINGEEAVIERPDGSRSHVLVHPQPEFSLSGQITGAINMFFDITELVNVREKLAASEAFSRSVVNSSPDCIKILDSEARLQFMNSNGLCLLEIEDFNLVKNKYWWDLWEKKDSQMIKDAITKALAGEKVQFQSLSNTYKGTPRWWDIIIIPIDIPGTTSNTKQLLSVSRDITKQKQQQLKEKELLTRFQTLVMQAPVAICVLRGENYVIEVINDDMLVMWDRTLEEVVDKPVFEVLPELMDQGFKELLDTVYNTGDRIVAEELPVNLKRHGKIEHAFVKFVYEPLRDVDGTVLGVMALAHEITGQVLARKNLEESEEQFGAAVAAVEGIVWTNNAKGEMEGEQSGWSSLTGQSYEAYQGYGWVNAIHPDDAQPTIDAWNEAVRERKNFVFQHRVRFKNGNWGHFSVKAIPLLNADGLIREWVGVHTDISERKQSEIEINYRKALLEAHIEASIDGILLVDAKGKIISYNHKFIEIWKMPLEIVEAKDDEAALAFAMQQLVHPEQFIEKVKYLYSHPTEINIDLLEFTDGKIVERHGYAVMATDGSYSAWSWTFRDITIQKLYEKNIKQSEEHFRFMANSMPQKVWTADAAGNKDYFNQTLLDYTGLTFEDLKDHGWQRVIHPEDWETNKILWQESMSTGKEYETENRLLRKDGEYLWHLTRAVALKDDDGKIKMWVGSKTEIQEQRQQKEELEEKVRQRTDQLIAANEELQKKIGELFITKEKLMSEYSRSLIEASLDPLVTINNEGQITDMNQATVNITGTIKKELTGSNIFDYFTEPQKAKEVYQQVFAKGSVINAPLTIRHVNGKLTDVFLNGSVYKDAKANVAGVVIVARDVTEQKRISTELTEAIIVSEMATAVAEDAKLKAEQAKQAAEDAVKSKQQFLSNMSHEIRTPMNAIIGFTKVILKTELTPKQKEYLTAIRLSGNSLIVLINDILDLAKVDAGKMYFEEIPFKMSSSIAAMMHLFETKVQEKNIVLVQEYDDAIPDTLLGDPVRLHQIILNLVSNAVKFTSTGKITVSVHLLEADEEKVNIQFTITDTGIGIPENNVDHIFENFHQASADTSRLYGGTGLGLAIVKQLVQSQGGTISVKSKINEGSVFNFTLSFKKTSQQAASEIEVLKSGAESRHIKVLVVEDIALNQLLMKTLLDDFGFERDIAANGKIAIEKLQDKAYDIILMDLQMPEMNGFEATDYIRNVLNSKIPIIALTADVTTVDLEKCMAVGMNDYIAKPVDESLLYSKINNLVKKPPEKKDALLPAHERALDKKIRYTDLAYLRGITKHDAILMIEMIALYLEQTPTLINTMKKSLQDEDWPALQAAAHKMIPSFSIMGMKKQYENIIRLVQDYKGASSGMASITRKVAQLDDICMAACAELEEEYNTLKNTIA